MRHVIMPLDVIDAHRVRDSRLLIEIEQVTLKIRVIDDPPEVAFKVAVIDHVEPNQGAK